MLFVCTLLSTGVLWGFDKDQLSSNIIIIRGYAGSEVLTVRNGLVLDSDDYNGYVLTNADLIGMAKTFTVLHPVSGAELIAQQVWVDNVLDLAMFKVSGLSLPHILFSAVSPREGDHITSISKSLTGTHQISFSRGSVRRVYPYASGAQTVSVMVHDAGIDEGIFGVAITNDCGELVGFNLQGEPDDLVRSITVTSLKSVLQRKKVTVNTAPEKCLSMVEQVQLQAQHAIEEARLAQLRAEEARKQSNELVAQLRTAGSLNQKLEKQAELAQSRAETAIQKVRLTELEIEKLRKEADARAESIMLRAEQLLADAEQDRHNADLAFRKLLSEQQQIASQRENLLIALLGVAILVVLVVIVFGKKRKNDKPDKVIPTDDSSSTKLVPVKPVEFVLDGKDSTGIRYLLRIADDELHEPSGVVIGRNPAGSAYVINHADVSRNHARMQIMKNRLFIEDLESTNGTIVNGQPIQNRGQVSIADGDQIVIGSVIMNLKVKEVA